MSQKDELILNISNILNDSKFWLKLEEVKITGEKKLGKVIDFSFIEEFAHDLEEFIADSIVEELTRIAIDKNFEDGIL